MADAVQVRLLGAFEVSSAGSAIAPSAWRLRKAKTLVKVLALQHGHTLHRDLVVDALWPDTDPVAARNNLHQVVHATRRAMATIGVSGADAMGWNDNALVLGPGCEVVTDLEALQERVAAINRDQDTAALAQLLQELPSELLPEDTYEAWAQPHVIRFREQRSQLVMQLVEMHIADSDPELAVTLLAPLVNTDPLHEPAQRALMTALAASGRRSEALLVFERLRAALRDELGADPEPPTRQLFRELLTQPAPTAAVPAQRSTGNLPARLTRLVGRERELAETAAALGRTRLLTLTGMGGVGKTTLALELGRGRSRDFPDGAHLIELGSIVDSKEVITQVARTLRLELRSDTQPVEAVVAQLRRRHVLLIIDSCEHLLDACADLIREILRGCPNVTIIATSREPLRIDGELTWRTPSLALPDPGATAAVADLADIAAVELFVVRASAAAPFALTQDNAPAVADICYRLDGIPLALELAAACVAFLSPQQIAERLGDSLELLRRGDRATVTRQQTLAATLAWSYDLLGPDEQTLFRRLSTFTGTFTLDAVEEICAADLDERRVLEALARLVDTSLVAVELRGDTARYRLLETVRQFAKEQLRATGGSETLTTRHCEWYLHFAEAHDPQSPAGRTDPASTAVELEHANLQAALNWALHHDPPSALRLCVAMWRYWLSRGLHADGRRWLEEVLAANPERTALRARALLALAVFDVRRGRAARLEQLGQEAVDIHRALPDESELARCLHAEGVLAFMRGDWDRCWDLTEESRATAGPDDHPVEVSARHMQGLVLAGRGQLDEARASLTLVRQLLATHFDVVHPFFLPFSLGYAVEGATHRIPRVFFEETMLPARHAGARHADAYVVLALGGVARLAGELDEARGLVDEARSRFSAIGGHDGEALSLSLLGCLHRVAGDLPEARAALTQSLRLRRALGDLRAVAFTETAVGVLTCTEGDTTTGFTMIADSLAGLEERHDTAAVAGIALTLASAMAEAGAHDSAVHHLLLTLPQMRVMPGNHRAAAWGYLQLGDLQEQLGHPADARRAYADAAQLFTMLGALDGLREVHVREAMLQTVD